MSQQQFEHAIDNLFSKHWRLILILIPITLLFIYFKLPVDKRQFILEKIGLEKLFSSGNRVGNIAIGNPIVDKILLGIILVLALIVLYFVLAELIRRKRFIYYRVIPHREDNASIDNIKNMMIAVHDIKYSRYIRWFLCRDWKSLIFYRNEEGKYFFFVGMDKSLAYQVEKAFQSAHYRCHFVEMSKEELPLPKNNKSYVGGRLLFKKRNKESTLPLAMMKEDFLVHLMNRMDSNTWIKIDLKSEREKDIKKSISETEDLYKEKKIMERTGTERSELRSLQKRFMTNAVSFTTYISLATSTQYGVEHLKSIKDFLGSKMNYENELSYRKFKEGVTYYPRRVGTLLVPNAGAMITTGSEIANIFHLPNFTEDKRESENEIIEKLVSNTELYDKTTSLLNEGVFDHEHGVTIGYAGTSDGRKRDIKVKISALKDHGVVTGKTGSGKSSFIVAILDGLLKSNVYKESDYAGLTFLDPGRDTALTLYNRLLKYEKDGATVDWKRINYIPIAKTDFPLALNLLDKDENISHAVIADAVTNIIESAIEDKAPIAERLMRKSIETLLADDRTHTILEVEMLINDKDTSFRDDILRRLKNNPANYDIINYWNNDAEQNIKTSGVALKNRIDIIKSSPILKSIFGQKNNEMDFKKMLDEGYINLLDLSELRDSELTIIAGYISFRMYTASLGRDTKSRFHLLAFDETKTMGNLEYVTRIVAETRKFNLATLIGAQMFNQLSREMKEALKDVQDNFISLQQGSKEAGEVATFVSDDRVTITAKDLMNLDTREGYIALKDTPRNAQEEDRYTVKVKINPLTKYGSHGEAVDYRSKEEEEAVKWSEKIANLNRIHYTGAKHKYEVDFEIMKLMQPTRHFSDEDLFKFTAMTKEQMHNIEAIRENKSDPTDELKQEASLNENQRLKKDNKSLTILTPMQEENDIEATEEEQEVKQEESFEDEETQFNTQGLAYLKRMNKETIESNATDTKSKETQDENVIKAKKNIIEKSENNVKVSLKDMKRGE